MSNRTIPASDPSLQSYVTPFLHDGEELLWVGQPYASTPVRPSVVAVVVSVFFLGFSLFWTCGAFIDGGFFGLFGLPFLGMGCFLVYMTFFGHKKRMMNTVYAVTGSRAIILCTGRKGTNCVEFNFARVQQVRMTTGKGTSGTICFAPETPNNQNGNLWNAGKGDADTSFVMIDPVQEVYQLVSELIAQAGNSANS